MEKYTLKTLNILKKLLLVNNDRTLGYQRAATEAKELDLQTVFLSLADESRKNSQILFREIKNAGGKPSMRKTTLAGKMFRSWIDFKTFLTGKDRSMILHSCEVGENAVQNIYNKFLTNADLPTSVRELLRDQQVSLRASADMIINYRQRTYYGFARS